MWHERTSPLDPILTQSIGWGEKRVKIEREEGRRNWSERSSHFFLDFSAIGPTASGETRGKVGPHYKSYAWVQVLGSFDKLREVGVLLLLWLFLA